jgi:RHS repeat-associated protein
VVNHKDYLQTKRPDLDGQLLAESTPAGAVIREYVNDGLVPVAQISGGVITYLHADHLGVPRIGTNSVKTVVWKWDGNAFGESAPSVQTVIVNRRFAGQFFDVETNLVQNWHRTYDPKHGRYLESDPVGLRGGINTYGYVEGNPLGMVDPTGEFGIAGALWGGGTDLAFQLLMNGGNLKCVNWKDVALASAGGALGGGLLNGIGKLKKGSNTWGATSKWLRGKNGPGGAYSPQTGHQYHHWFIEQNSMVGKLVPDAIKNQPWNLNPIKKVAHDLIHGNAPGGVQYGSFMRWLEGTPGWAKGVELGISGAMLAPGDTGGNCECQ